MIRAHALVCSLFAGLAATSCVGTTGSDLVTFKAAAAGPADAVEGKPLEFTSGRGFHVVLTRATLHIGSLYLNKARPVSGAQATNCILPGIYVGEVTQGLDVDTLSPTPQLFPGTGEGTADPAVVGEVWLTFGDVNAPEQMGTVLDLAGTADLAGVSYPFTGQLTIGSNRAMVVTDPSQPSLHPICKERIVSPISVDLTPSNGGSLLLRVDPRGWFTNVDFSALTQVSDSPPAYVFEDETDTGPDANLYRGIQAHEGVYQFIWSDSPNP